MVLKGNDILRSEHRTMWYAVSHKPSHTYQAHILIYILGI